MKEIVVTIQEKEYTFTCGISVEEVMAKAAIQSDEAPIPYKDNPYIGALVNYEFHSCSKALTADCTLEPVRLFSDMGKRMYRHSLSYLLCAAVSMLYPSRRLIIGHALGDGYYFRFDDNLTLSGEDILAIERTMWKLIDGNFPIEEVVLPYEVALSYFKEQGFEQTAALLETHNEPNLTLYSLQGYMDITYEPLLSRTALMQVWELKPYQEQGMLLRYPRSRNWHELQPFVDNQLLFSVFKEYKAWGSILGVQALGQLNRMGNEQTVGEFVRLAEALQEKKIASIADQINLRSSSKAILIAGPSSSGKTTFAHKLDIHLQVLGKKTIKIGLDNYYLPPSKAPKDEWGNPDLESLDALHVELFQKDLNRLLDKEAVVLPVYDFKTSTRSYTSAPVKMDNRTLLIIEGIHGMNPDLTSYLDRDVIFRIYISALTQLNLDDHNRISTTDNRIIRRMVRDYRTRGASAEETLNMWPSVHRGEDRYIFPYQNNADAMINSALDYELGVLTTYVQPLLRMVKPSANHAYETARRLLRFLEQVNPIPATLVPPDSLLREFIGGSEFGVT